MAGTVLNVHEHGFWVEGRTRVECKHCGKRMSNFFRLKLHLANTGKDVTHCGVVDPTIKVAFFAMIMKMRSRSGRGLPGRPKRSRACKDMKAAAEANKQFQRCVARFIYENGVDFSAAESTNFKEMIISMMAVAGGKDNMWIKFPDSRDLKGWMLQEALKEVQDRVNEIKVTWEITGCSILLDAWIDQRGRDLVSFVADCPAGPVYLNSYDVSGIRTNVTALKSLVKGIVEEVGVQNVIQIVACSTTGWVGDLNKLLGGEDMKLFWSVSLSHCIELMLLEIGKLYSFGDILDRVNIIQEFINNKPSLLRIFRAHSHGVYATALVSEFGFLTPYLTVENMLRAMMAGMFASPDWKKEECTVAVASLVYNSSFWEAVGISVRGTSALVHGVRLFATAKNKHVGYIYDIIRSIKVSTASNFQKKKEFYKPVWDVIDDVWNQHFGNPLHATGYFLNPASYYSGHFHFGRDVCTGLVLSLAHMVKGLRQEVTISEQVNMYKSGESCYKEASQADQISGISPIEWWTKNGSQHPELKSFAIKILSQTCEGASKYKLKRSLAEKLLAAEWMSYYDKKRLEELAYVHYNLHLQTWQNQSI
ncbi:PREDICTED: uncharacterized protein LOC104745526 isoform X1 [Camelina sativa]|uniref:Uncharacterized protein LOC104745526 isoform X1 n=2 Tax=Camelina sativa TaxID=90675 RepID=A0ABM0W3A8_CAMSA|nr:PREDICTED: uncharacterized protein LOC104745526 isoform X1 [Camelina sativa]